MFSTGWFRECIPDAVDTRDGVKLVIKVRSMLLCSRCSWGNLGYRGQGQLVSRVHVDAVDNCDRVLHVIKLSLQ